MCPDLVIHFDENLSSVCRLLPVNENLVWKQNLLKISRRRNMIFDYYLIFLFINLRSHIEYRRLFSMYNREIPSKLFLNNHARISYIYILWNILRNMKKYFKTTYSYHAPESNQFSPLMVTLVNYFQNIIVEIKHEGWFSLVSPWNICYSMHIHSNITQKSFIVLIKRYSC